MPTAVLLHINIRHITATLHRRASASGPNGRSTPFTTSGYRINSSNRGRALGRNGNNLHTRATTDTYPSSMR